MEPSLFDIGAQEFLRFSLVLLRISAILFTLPIFGDANTPVRVRILMSVALGFGFFHLIPPTWGVVDPKSSLEVGLLVFKELMLGFILGFVAKTVFEAIISAAGVVGFQMGFGTSSMFLPDVDPQSNSFTLLHRSFMILIFLSLSLHHLFIQSIADSFVVVPVGALQFNGNVMDQILKGSINLFVIGLQLAAPILIALMFTMAALGLIARTVPQLNVFIISFPLSFFVGLLIYLATLPLYPNWINSKFKDMRSELVQAMTAQ
jgi:flagellar biosynthetic protein FliR